MRIRRRLGRAEATMALVAALCLVMAACGGSETEPATDAGTAGAAPGTEEPGTDSEVASDATSSAPEAAGDVETVKIAAPFGLTGAVGPFSVPYVNALELAVEEVNSAGGIESLGGAQLELLVQDNQSNPELAVQLLREMKADGAALTLAPFASGMVLATKPVVIELDLPMLVPSAAAAITEGEHNNTIWRFRLPEAAVAEDGMEFIAAAREAGEIEVDSMAVLAIAGGAGDPYVEAVEREGEELGIDVLSISYDPAETRDFGPIVAQLREADVDLVTGFQYPADAILFAESLFLQDWRPSAGFVWLEGAYGELAIREALGSATEGWMDVGFAASSDCEPFNEFAEEYEERYGEPLVGLAAAAPAAIEIVVDVVERAGSVEPDALRAAFAETSIGYCEDSLYALAGGVEFNEQGDNTAYRPTIVQHEGELGLVPVGPEAVRLREPIWPAGGG